MLTISALREIYAKVYEEHGELEIAAKIRAFVPDETADVALEAMARAYAAGVASVSTSANQN